MLPWAVSFGAGAGAVLALPTLGASAAAAIPGAAALLLARGRPLVAAACAGFAWTLLLAGPLFESGWPCERDREVAAVTGRIASPPLERHGRIDFDLEVTASDLTGTAPRRLRVAWYEADGRPAPGECWRMSLRLRCRRGFANPGAPDRELALLRDRIDATAYVAGPVSPERLDVPALRPIERLRARVADGIAAAVAPGPSVAVLQGLSVGVRGAIPDPLWEAFSVTGIAHLMAISGLHVTGCALCVLALLRLAWRLPMLDRLPARTAIECLVVVVTTAAYALLAGGSLPALRTLAMVAIFAGLRALRRAWPLHRTLALAAIVLIACDPLALSSAGFWLSFVATAALVAAATRATGWRGRVASFARSQLAVTALLAPVLALSFGRISLVAPMVNAIAIPIFSVALLPAVLGATLMTAVEPAAWPALWAWLATLLDAAWPALETIAELPMASWSPAVQPGWFVGIVGVAALAGLLLPIAGLRCAALAMLLAAMLGRARPPDEGGFSVTAVDVGQGLAVVVETARHVLVFDSGPRWQGSGSAARFSLLPYLRARGLRRIDRLVLSHDDADHAGGADVLAEALPIHHTMRAPASRLPGDEQCLRGLRWHWDGVEFRVLHPPPAFAGGDNDGSCAIAVVGAGGTALLLADPERAAEAELVSQEIAADLVLLPHHGSRSSSSPELIAKVGARLGIASAGFGNRWGMPDTAVVARWRAAGSTVLVTADEGAVRAEFPRGPGPLRLVTERRGAPHWWRARPTG